MGRCANPECNLPANTDPDYSEECPGFCCEKCMGRFNGEEWGFTGKRHTAFCSGAQSSEGNSREPAGKSKSKGKGYDKGKGGCEKGAGTGKGAGWVWFDPSDPMAMGMMMQAMKGMPMKGNPMAMKGGPMGMKGAPMWCPPVGKGGGMAMSRGRCAHPECTYLKNSDPSISRNYCCEKCEGLHQGADWAEGGKRHYKNCEKIEADAGPSIGGWGGGKGSQRGGCPGVQQKFTKPRSGSSKPKDPAPAEQEVDEGDSFLPEQKVWIAKLPKGTDAEVLKEHFEQIGEVLYVWASKGTSGIIAFASAEEAQTAVEVLNETEFNDHIIEVSNYAD
eukprot:TRINITY_DN73808_c0_g1_i1.p1 TRINITY_DN73808_c0_g1~~TRINITY_DN73808_c0_g1_i1.p1  ORF type:complete len:332 (+),score=59.75 TRINITY_DN73808_c0_g1_i1:64-1059(+)